MNLLSFLPIVDKLLERVLPDKNAREAAKLKLLEMQQAGDFRELDAELELIKAQTSVNLEEAKSQNLFKSGWRPSIGWVCGLSFGWHFMVQPFAVFILVATGSDMEVNSLPKLDVGSFMPVLLGMLGLGGLRTYEKFKGVSNG